MRTLDDIVPPSRRKEPADEIAADRAPLRPGRAHSRDAGARFPYVSAGVALVIIIGAAMAIWHYSGAEVQVTPNLVTVSASGSYTASAAGGELSFRVISADKIASQTVQGTGTETVNSAAQGTVTISNTQKVVQKLIANTQFATPAGLIFRIHAPVSVPANGSVQATVYADKPGAEYNIGPSTFTLPKLTGAAHTAVTAKSSAAMSGGASGTRPTVNPAALATARTALKTALAPDLADELKSSLPAGYVLLPGAATTNYKDVPPSTSGATGMVDIKEEGTISAVVFPNAALAKALATQVEGTAYSGEPVTIEDPSTLTLIPAADIPDASAATFAFSLSGTAKLLSTIDPNQIASAVAGRTRTAAEVALTNYPSVKQAVLILRPFWASAFPDDPAAIRVKVETPANP